MDRAIADAALQAATAAGGAAKDLARAAQALEKGLAAAAEGAFDVAIDQFGKAWEAAQKSL